MKAAIWAWMGLAAVFAVGCGEDGAAVQEGEESAEGEACEHMVEGPAEAVTASAEASEAPDGTVEHARLDVDLVDVGGSPGGFVAYEVAEAGEVVFFLSDGAAFVLRDAVGAVVAEGASGPVAACEAVVVFHQFELDVGTYAMDFEGSEQTSVSVVVEALGDRGDG